MGKFKEDVTLSKFELVQEAERMPGLLLSYGEDLARAKKEKDSAATDLELKKSQAELAIRKSDPKSFGLDKYTEAVIAALVPTDNTVIEATARLNEAKENVYTLEAAMEAMRDKSSEIRVLKDLYATGYYTVGECESGSKRTKITGGE